MYRKIFLLVFLTFTAQAAEDMGASGFYISNTMTTYQSSDVQKLLNQLTVESPDKNILFYIHGRSQTLEKEWINIHKIEERYNVRVLMLHWESWNYMLGRPVANAYEASAQFALALGEIATFKMSHQELFKNHKIFMMFHSMGNLVLKNYIEKFNVVHDVTLFNTVILTGADLPFTGHKKWLNQMKLSEDVFVVMNQSDSVLLASVAHDYLEFDLFSKNDDRLGLGKGLDNILFLNTATVAGAFYFDISGLTEGEHRHYLSSRHEVEDLFHYMFKEQFEQIPLKYKVKKNYYRF